MNSDVQAVEFVRPDTIAKLEARIQALRGHLHEISHYEEDNPNAIFIQARHAPLMRIARQAIEEDDRKILEAK